MSFTGRTPESLIPRSDSRNPATTCKGITKAGGPCRRPIDTKPSRNEGVIAVVSVVDDSDDEDIGAAAYFCWQHKDQAEQLAAQNSDGPRTQLYPLRERNSIDTLVERLGVLDIDDAEGTAQGRARKSRQEDQPSQARPRKKINRPPTWNNVEGPLMSVPSDIMAEQYRRQRRHQSQPSKKKLSLWTFLCCGSVDEEPVPANRHKSVSNQSTRRTKNADEVSRQQRTSLTQGRTSSRPGLQSLQSTSHIQSDNAVPISKTQSGSPRPPLSQSSRRESETTSLLRYIPSTLTPQLTSILLAELSKPISLHDEEGYIYIFWLTSDSLGPAPSMVASELLAPPTRPDHGRQTSDVLRQYSVKKSQEARPTTKQWNSGNSHGISEKDTILLKIGRASNVHRRMHEWTRQCGYSLSLVRYYPYVSSAPSPSPSSQASPAQSRRSSSQNIRSTDPIRRASEGVRKVPHVHRVERLIHLELSEQRVVKKCETCGKEHREWFQIEASREGVKRVDEIVKRWVDWAERNKG